MFLSRTRHCFRLAAAVHLWAFVSISAPTGPTAKPKDPVAERLGEDAELARATGLYDTGQYEACVDAFDRLLSIEEPRRLHSPAKIETARTYHGACLIGVGRTTDAERVFKEAILENPQMKAPDGLLFPEAVVELFLRVRESMMDEIRRAEHKRIEDAENRANREQQLRERERLRIAELVAFAEKETVVERHSRWVASIPFGVGQFQNGNSGLGWAFLLGETASCGLLFGSLYMQAWYQAQADRPNVDVEGLNGPIHTTIALQKIGGYGLLGLGLLGIAEAHLSFVPEVRFERQRSIPEQLRDPPTKPPALSLRWLPWTSRDGLGAAVAGEF